MWEDLTTGLCVLGFTAAITVLLIELPAVFDLRPIVADQRLPLESAAGIAKLNLISNPDHRE